VDIYGSYCDNGTQKTPVSIYSFIKISPQGTIKTIKNEKNMQKNTYTYTSKKFKKYIKIPL